MLPAVVYLRIHSDKTAGLSSPRETLTQNPCNLHGAVIENFMPTVASAISCCCSTYSLSAEPRIAPRR